MKSRREFIRSGLALTTSSCLAGAAFRDRATSGVTTPAWARRADEPMTGPWLGISLVVFDRQFADSRDFGAAARGLGRAVHAISGDVTALWYEQLYPLWKRPGTAIGGLTGVSALFCLEQLGWKSERRVVFRVRHERGDANRLRHTLLGPAGLAAADARASRHLLPDAADWPKQMAQQLSRIPQQARAVMADGTAIATGSTASRNGDDWHEPLVSWVLAPRRLQDRITQESAHVAARS